MTLPHLDTHKYKTPSKTERVNGIALGDIDYHNIYRRSRSSSYSYRVFVVVTTSSFLLVFVYNTQFILDATYANHRLGAGRSSVNVARKVRLRTRKSRTLVRPLRPSTAVVVAVKRGPRLPRYRKFSLSNANNANTREANNGIFHVFLLNFRFHIM